MKSSALRIQGQQSGREGGCVGAARLCRLEKVAWMDWSSEEEEEEEEE